MAVDKLGTDLQSAETAVRIIGLSNIGVLKRFKYENRHKLLIATMMTLRIMVRQGMIESDEGTAYAEGYYNPFQGSREETAL